MAIAVCKAPPVHSPVSNDGTTDTAQAVGQITSTASMRANLEQCVSLVSKAARGGAKVRFPRWSTTAELTMNRGAVPARGI